MRNVEFFGGCDELSGVQKAVRVVTAERMEVLTNRTIPAKEWGFAGWTHNVTLGVMQSRGAAGCLEAWLAGRNCREG